MSDAIKISDAAELQHKYFRYKKRHPLLLGFKRNASGSRGQVSWRTGIRELDRNIAQIEAENIEKYPEEFTDWDDCDE